MTEEDPIENSPIVPSIPPNVAITMQTGSSTEDASIRSETSSSVIQDVAEDTQGVTLYTWIEAITGFPQAQLRNWCRSMFSQGWFFHSNVANALEKFCEASEKTARYDSFTEIANHVILKAKDTFEDVPQQDPDIKFLRNCTQCFEKHSFLGAPRKPDMVGIRDVFPRTNNVGKPPGAKWPAALIFAEFKLNDGTDVRSTLERVNHCREILSAARAVRDVARVKVPLPDIDALVRLLSSFGSLVLRVYMTDPTYITLNYANPSR